MSSSPWLPQEPQVAAPESLALSLDQAGALLGCHGRTIRNLIARGELRSFTIGRLRRVRRVDLEAYLARLAGESRNGTDAVA